MYYLGSFPNSLTPWHQRLQHSHCQHGVLYPAKPSSWRERINKTRHSAAVVGLFGHNKQLKEPQQLPRLITASFSAPTALRVFPEHLQISHHKAWKRHRRSDTTPTERRATARLRLRFWLQRVVNVIQGLQNHVSTFSSTTPEMDAVWPSPAKRLMTKEPYNAPEMQETWWVHFSAFFLEPRGGSMKETSWPSLRPALWWASCSGTITLWFQDQHTARGRQDF